MPFVGLGKVFLLHFEMHQDAVLWETRQGHHWPRSVDVSLTDRGMNTLQ